MRPLPMAACATVALGGCARETARTNPGSTDPCEGITCESTARGNLRDSDATPSPYGNSLANGCVHFDEPVP